MKKSALSFLFIAATVAYVVYLRLTGSINVSVPASSVAQSVLPQAPAGQIVDTSSQVQATSGEPPQNSGQASATTNQSAPVVQSPAKPKSAGMYTDGTYTGNSADAYYGTVQVQAVVKNGALASVNFLQYPKDRRTSQSISDRAMPILESEAIQSQSANVNIVSGATDTSSAFQQSLASALSQAKS